MTILETTPIMNNLFCEYVVLSSFCSAVILFPLVFICGLLYCVFMDKNMCKAAERAEQIVDILFGLETFFAVLCLGGLFVCGIYQPDYTGRNQYKVLIDDSVSFNEIAENYEIVGQDGDLYILEDKESVNE